MHVTGTSSVDAGARGSVADQRASDFADTAKRVAGLPRLPIGPITLPGATSRPVAATGRVAVMISHPVSYAEAQQDVITAAWYTSKGITPITDAGKGVRGSVGGLGRYVRNQNGGKSLDELKVLVHGSPAGDLGASATKSSPNDMDVLSYMRALKREGVVGPGTHVYFHACAVAATVNERSPRAGPQAGQQLLQQAANETGATVHAYTQIQWQNRPPVGPEIIFRPQR